MATIPERLAAAVKHHEAGRLGEAERIYRAILRADPNHPDALHLLGVIAHQSGKHEAAIELIARAVERKGDVAGYHSNLAAACKAAGQDAEAARHARRAIELQPDYAEAHNNLGAALRELGRLAEAEAHYRRAVEIKPDYADALSNLANLLRGRGDLDEAVRFYRRAVAIHPRHAATYSGLGKALLERGEVDKAIECQRRALAIDPKLRGGRTALGVALQRKGLLDEAVVCFRQAVADDPTDADARTNLGVALHDQGNDVEALEHCRRAVEMAPDHDKAHGNLAGLLQERGQLDEAIVHLRKAVELDPAGGQSLVNLANSRKYTEADRAEIDRMEALLAEGNLPQESRMFLHFALGKIHDDCKSWDRAFAHFREANRLADVQFDEEAVRDHLEATIETCDRALLAEGAELGRESDLPVFIVGMPRSATTLVEQILASHPRVFGAGELMDIARMSRTVRPATRSSLPQPRCLVDLDGDTAGRLADAYLRRLRELGGDAARVTDKMPTNFWHLGLIALLLPKAKVIHCRRDPLDVCLSCYFQSFRSRLAFAYDLHSLGVYYRFYERLMAHWREALPLAMFEIDYEDLLGDPELVSRDLVEFCGLEWDAACLDFHKNPRVVRTASNWQVRQPIFTSSLRRWKHYEKHLGPLTEALGQSISADG